MLRGKKTRIDSCLDWTCNLLAAGHPVFDNIILTVTPVLYPHTTSHTMIKLSSPIALGRISLAKWGWASDIERKQASGLYSAARCQTCPTKALRYGWEKQNLALTLTPLPTSQEPKGRKGKEDFVCVCVCVFWGVFRRLLFLLERLTGVRHQPGHVWPLLWRQFTAQPLILQEHWKCWHKPGNMRILSAHIPPENPQLDIENRINLFMPES